MAPESGSTRHLASVPDTYKTRCSVIVVTYNSAETLERSLTSFLQTISPEDEIVIIDNASTDDTYDSATSLVRSFIEKAGDEAPAVRLIASPVNVGLARARNRGIAEAAGDYFVFADPDIVVTEGWLSALIDYLIAPCIGAVGPIIDYGPGMQNALVHLPERQVLEARPWEDESDVMPPRAVGEQKSVRDVAELALKSFAGRSADAKSLTGACIALRRSVMEELGGFDEDLFLGNEDLEYCLRLRAHNYRLLVAQDIFISHREHASLEQADPEWLSYVLQLSTNRLAEKVVAEYASRNEHPPGPGELWDVETFGPSQQRISIGVIQGIPGQAKRTIKAITDQSVIPLEAHTLAATGGALEEFLHGEGDLFIVLKAGVALDPAWMSRVTAARDISRDRTVFLPTWTEPAGEDDALQDAPPDHGLVPAEPDFPLDCVIFSAEAVEAAGELDVAGDADDLMKGLLAAQGLEAIVRIVDFRASWQAPAKSLV